MKYRNILAMASAAFLLGAGNFANAATEDDAKSEAAEQRQQERLDAEYQRAMAEAEKQQQKAKASLENAREQLERVSRERELSERENAETRAAREAAMAKMNEELDRARRELQETSRELARVTGESLTDAITVALRERLERVRPDRTDLVERLRRKGGDRDRHFLQRLFALAGRDDDFL